MTGRIAAAVAVATTLVALAAGGIAQAGAPQAHSSAHHKRHHKKHHKRRIPQHNGGDHDADNNGGPSDGDGNI